MDGRRSASPPPHRSRDAREYSGSGDRRHEEATRARRNYDEPDRGHSSRRGQDRHGREYSERDRERERARDRERYEERQNEGRSRDRDRDRERGPDRGLLARRSASPRQRSSRPRSRSHPRSRSPSPASKAKADFKPSGLLAAETNTVRAANGDSTVLKYNEPPEARKPVLGWRLYVFKGDEQVELLHIHRQSAYLVGRDRLVADISVDHPSCSKQHAVIQYRFVRQNDEFGQSKGVIKPFIIDLESTNSTFVNDEAIPVSRYYELKASDVIKFGQSTREYVLLHDEAE
ncbi:smad nuclear interacting protein 1 [Mycena pura]|uniref:Smad nuclear interacting protein 1 n=1 Tax=Mycena pura TaxID=153505 RepID=A0AAD6ULG9_9AGAR|nr:smad nuclear interacting protein 1 [Mycena pura]